VTSRIGDPPTRQRQQEADERPNGMPHREGEPAGGAVGYVLKCFPRISETFILNEILELERNAVDLRIYSMNEPKEAVRHRLASRVRSPIEYLPNPLLASAGRYARAHLAIARRFPWRYLRTLVGVLASFDRDLLERFVQAGYLSGLVRRDGIRHLHAGFVHFPGSVSWLVHRILGIPYSLATHAKDYVHSPPRLLRKKLSEAEFVFTCTRFNVDSLKRIVAPATIRRLRRVYHGTDLRRFPYETCGRADPPLILAVGRLVEKKGFEHLIDACSLLSDRGRRFHCTIVAGAYDLGDQLVSRIQRHGLSDVVTIEGPLDQDEVREHYREATVLAMPCIVAKDGDRDGIPNVLVEAAATGVPIVSTDVSGIPELIRHEDTGLVVPPRDAEALADAIEELLDSPELRETLRARARQFVEAEFDLSRNAVLIAEELHGAAGGATVSRVRKHHRPVEAATR
jgi:glycosyltransferase involved in cell wall biosynthesis